MAKEEQNIINIINGCINGNRKAQQQLYSNYYGAMMNLCLRYAKNEQDALEMLNTGFYKVYKNIEKFDRSKAVLYTWIRTIIINSCLDFIKVKNTIYITGEFQQAASIQVPPVVFSNMSAAEILVLIRQLPAATQTVFNLYIMEGYKHLEIAELLNISEGTSKWHLSDGRKKLQKMIQEQNN